MNTLKHALHKRGITLKVAAETGIPLGTITGYLVGTLDRFNNAKRAEEQERVKHG